MSDANDLLSRQLVQLLVNKPSDEHMPSRTELARLMQKYRHDPVGRYGYLSALASRLARVVPVGATSRNASYGEFTHVSGILSQARKQVYSGFVKDEKKTGRDEDEDGVEVTAEGKQKKEATFKCDMQPRGEANKLLRFSSIAGSTAVKRMLVEQFALPLFLPKLSSISTGLLLYGPPGTGKTNVAMAFANEMTSIEGIKVGFVKVSGADMESKWKGGTQKNVQELFACARRFVKEHTTNNTQGVAVVFIDEVDTLFKQRGGENNDATATNEFLVQMDGGGAGDKTNCNVILIAATNRPMDLDMAFMRRLPQKVFMGRPTVDDIGDMIIKFLDDRAERLLAGRTSDCSFTREEKKEEKARVDASIKSHTSAESIFDIINSATAKQASTLKTIFANTLRKQFFGSDDVDDFLTNVASAAQRLFAKHASHSNVYNELQTLTRSETRMFMADMLSKEKNDAILFAESPNGKVLVHTSVDKLSVAAAFHYYHKIVRIKGEEVEFLKSEPSVPLKTTRRGNTFSRGTDFAKVSVNGTYVGYTYVSDDGGRYTVRELEGMPFERMLSSFKLPDLSKIIPDKSFLTPAQEKSDAELASFAGGATTASASQGLSGSWKKGWEDVLKKQEPASDSGAENQSSSGENQQSNTGKSIISRLINLMDERGFI